MENISYPTETNAVVDRPERRIEGLINQLHGLNAQASEVANRLLDMRRRLIGMDEGTESAPKLKEAVSSEVGDLQRGLDDLADTLGRIDQYVGNLESV